MWSSGTSGQPHGKNSTRSFQRPKSTEIRFCLPEAKARQKPRLRKFALRVHPPPGLDLAVSQIQQKGLFEGGHPIVLEQSLRSFYGEQFLIEVAHPVLKSQAMARAERAQASEA